MSYPHELVSELKAIRHHVFQRLAGAKRHCSVDEEEAKGLIRLSRQIKDELREIATRSPWQGEALGQFQKRRPVGYTCGL